MTLRERITSKQFTIVADVALPKGIDASPLLQTCQMLKPMVHAFHVADGQDGAVALSSLATSCLLRQAGLSAVCQLSCRDRNRIALQSELLGIAALGIENVVITDGDHLKLGQQPHTKPVYDIDSVQLLQMAARLRQEQGTAMERDDGKGIASTLYLGTSVKPSFKLLEAQIIKLEKKAASGLDFLMIQPVFEASQFEAFHKTIEHLALPIFVGIPLLDSAEAVEALGTRSPIPENVAESLVSAASPISASVEIAAKLVRNVQGLCAGIHIIAPGLERHIPEVLSAAGIGSQT